jgi:signal transduction histidine kinase
MKRFKLRRSYVVRVGAWFVGIFAIALITAFATFYVKIRADLESAQKRFVLEKQAALLKSVPKADVVSIGDLIAKKINVSSDNDTIYLLTGPNGQFVAGNVSAIPYFSGWRFVPWTNVKRGTRPTELEEVESVLGLWTDVAGGRLFVGNSDGDVLEARDMLLEGLAISMGVALSVAGIGGILLALQARKHIAMFSGALDKVADGNLAARVATSGRRDELDHIADRINSALNRLQVSVESLQQATTDIAHDLKSPISRLRLRLQKALDSPQPIADSQDLIGNSLTEIDKIADTFDALLSISQIEGGSKKQGFICHSLSRILFTVNDAFGAVAEDAGHRLNIDIESLGEIQVMGEKELLTQLFANLIENAIRHCPPGTEITLSGESTPSGPVVSVGDNGPGIPESERKNVFRRLYRLEKSRTTPGNGLGLALVSAIADLHDATVAMLDNHPGLRVEVHFPTNSRPSHRAAAE